MYDIEGKYKKLMQIADGKIPKKNRYDKQKKYLSECARFGDIKVIINHCKDDEKIMLKLYFMYQKEMFENGKIISEIINFIMVCFTLIIYTLTLATSNGIIKIDAMNLEYLVYFLGIVCVIYILIYGICAIVLKDRLKKVIFILNVFDHLL